MACGLFDQAGIRTNATPLETNFSEILIQIQTFAVKKIDHEMSSKMPAILSRPQYVRSTAAKIE